MNAEEQQAYDSSSSSLMMKLQGLEGIVVGQVCWSTLTFGRVETPRDQCVKL